MITVTKKTKVHPNSWLEVQALTEPESQEVDAIIFPQRPPAAERPAA